MNSAGADPWQILRFVLVGASSTGLYFLLLWGLRDGIDSIVVLTSACYAISMLYNYALQSWLTFRAGPPNLGSMARFVAMHLGAMALNAGLMAGLVQGLGAPLFAAQVLVTAIISAMVFLLSRHWVYRLRG
ncbi:Putative flippase GtrA (transmembrane translocase of bactoprenol-linked glucose) [Paracoccus thiocyanatus]|uniref:Flippase GtrA (Transmembrane translocase of bactoprenol-linked glucose) n=1 Tax=Paracoccus thiocyanatus TaxID=34006 RepID=A0A1N6U271_9RHOB|nr:GtrA family protein [Paracoccus thiocyanatus]SIQ59627.1 Putative flippase GtrA (transmembrane translocase of bactoprenol-linked glucose) [Paracoccus thiocyanatus]